MRRWFTAGVATLLACTAVGMLSGCGGSASSSGSSSAAIGMVTGHGGASSAAPQKDAAVPLTPAPPSAVIKTAELSLGLARGMSLDGRMQRAAAIADAAGGWVESSTLETTGAHLATATLRVPSDRFDGVMGQLEGLGKVRSVGRHGQDVTRQLVDIQARLVNLMAQRHVLLGLMNRAHTINASIEVENQLSQVQGQIEQLQGDQRYLDDRAAMGTITLTMSMPAAAPPAPDHPGALRRALSRAVDAAESVITATIVGLGFVLPIALIGIVVLLVVRRFWPSLRERAHVKVPDERGEAL